MQRWDLIKVEYEQLPAVYDVNEAMKPGAPQLYDQFPITLSHMAGLYWDLKC